MNYSTNTRNFDSSRDDNNDTFRQGDNNPNRSSRREPPQGYDDSPPRGNHQGDDRRQHDTSNRGNRNTDRRQYNENQYEDVRATESRTTPRASIRVTDNSRLLESRDTRIPEDVGTVTRTAGAPRKRALPPQEGPTSRKRQASPPGSPERPTYVRLLVTLIITPNPNESPRKFHGKFGFLPHSPWILQTSWCYPQRIASSITSCKEQRSELQRAVSTPMQRTRYDRRYHGIYMIVRHRSTYPRYRLPHPVRPLQRL